MNDHDEPGIRPGRDSPDRPARGVGRREAARASGPRAPRAHHRGLRLLALLTVIGGVLLLAAAAFVFSYTGVHDIAVEAGVPPGLARLFPALPDAVLVVACAAALMLRGARWWTRWLAWLSMLAVVALAGSADAVHAMAIRLPRRPAAAGAAVLPWALLLLSVWLWVSVMRHTRPSTASSPRAEREVGTGPEPAASPDGASQAREPVAAAQGAVTALGLMPSPPGEPDDDGLDTAAELAIDAEPEPDDPASGDDVGTHDTSGSDGGAEPRPSSGRHARDDETPYALTFPLLGAPVPAKAASVPEPPLPPEPAATATSQPPPAPDETAPAAADETPPAAADETPPAAPEETPPAPRDETPPAAAEETPPAGAPPADFRRVRSSPLRPGGGPRK